MDICCPAFADDISLIALYKPSLQVLLDKANNHSSKWRYDFNPSKTHVFVFGRDYNPGTDLHLGNHTLDVVDMDKHLGVPLTTGKVTSGISGISGRISNGRCSFL